MTYLSRAAISHVPLDLQFCVFGYTQRSKLVLSSVVFTDYERACEHAAQLSLMHLERGSQAPMHVVHVMRLSRHKPEASYLVVKAMTQPLPGG